MIPTDTPVRRSTRRTPYRWLAAVVHRESSGEIGDARRWLEQATYSIGTFRDISARDGSYNEGISCAHYTTLHIIHAVDALCRRGARPF